MQVVICDDESVYLDSIRRYVEYWARETQHVSCVLIKTFASSEDLLEAWSNGMPIDMLFLDIQIPGELSGMDIAKKIHSRDEYIPIVFITNYSEYVFEGYAVNALRYLRKPISQGDIDICMDIAWRQWSNGHDQFLMLSTITQSIRVPIDAIIYIEAVSHTLRIFTADEIGIYEIRDTLERMESKLPQEGFVRCHRSFIVSLRHIRKYKNGMITILTGTTIPVGRKHMQLFSSKFRAYYQGGNE